MHSQLREHGGRVDGVSRDYTGHCWAKDPVKLVVTTSSGEVIVCKLSGEYELYLSDQPIDGRRIDSIIPYNHGLFLGGEGGTIWQF